MDLVGPETYQLSYTPTAFTVLCSKGTPRFSGAATKSVPKVYIASIDGRPVYVGVTTQSMRTRLRNGWKASGENGYYGYAWRNRGAEAALSVWTHTDADERSDRDVKTVEAEIVYLIRHRTGQWPGFQTEIHFYSSTKYHRQIAERIVGHYGI